MMLGSKASWAEVYAGPTISSLRSFPRSRSRSGTRGWGWRTISRAESSRMGPPRHAVKTKAMIRLTQTLHEPDGAPFRQALKTAIERLGVPQLPLEQRTSQGGRVADRTVTATVLGVTEGKGRIEAQVGLFFTEMVGGCSCGEDPMEVNAYCGLRLSIDPETGRADIAVVGS